MCPTAKTSNEEYLIGYDDGYSEGLHKGIEIGKREVMESAMVDKARKDERAKILKEVEDFCGNQRNLVSEQIWKILTK